MKKILIALTAVAATSFGATALAEEAISGPVMMTDGDMAQFVAGTRFQNSAPDRTNGNTAPVDGPRGTDNLDQSYDGLVKASGSGNSRITSVDTTDETKPQGRF